MKKIIIIAILLISNLSFYGAVNDEGEKVNNIQELLENEAVIENEVAKKEENTQEEIVSQETKENEITEEVKDTEEQEKATNETVITKKEVENNDKSKETKENVKVNETKKEVAVTETTPKVATNTIQVEKNKEIQVEKKQEITKEQEVKKEEKVVQCTNDKHQMPTGNSNKWFNTKDEAVKYYKSLQKLWSDKLVNNEVDDDEYDANCPYGYQNWSCPECNMITLDFYFRIEQN